jgi:methionine synthase I (cobalamin-dependent)
MTREAFLDRLAQRPLLADGGMGTQLMARGLMPGVSGELWNIDQPEAIQAIHRDYREAGCDLLTTNSFQGTRQALMMHGLSEKVAEVNTAAARNARAAADGALVMGDVGPFGGFLEPMGETTPEQLEEIFTEQLAALQAGGADLIVVETMSDPQESAAAIRAAKLAGDWPVIATFAFQKVPDGFATMMGTSPGEAIARVRDAGADVVGANCGTALSLADYLDLARALVSAAGETPVIVQPNAGAPEEQDGTLHWPASPDDMADLVPQLLDAGVRIIGGCCGTTPNHLAAMARALPR